MFAKDTMKNAVHSSSNVEKATAVIHEFFPEVELNPDGTVKGTFRYKGTKVHRKLSDRKVSAKNFGQKTFGRFFGNFGKKTFG